VNYRATERIFLEAHNMGFSADDVKIAVKYLIRFNNKSDGPKFRVNVFRVIGDIESFAALIAEARAVDRNRRADPTPKDKIVALYQQTQNPDEAPTVETAVQAKEILKKAVANL
jgi:hypothetical protein